MASADVEREAARSASVPSTPSSSAVFSTASTAALSLHGLSRQSSAATLTGEDAALSPPELDPRAHFHRVASEQLLPTASELSARAQLATMQTRATSMIVGKVTSRRRQRNPRRFVVTELPPEPDEFLSETSPQANGESDARGNGHQEIRGEPSPNAVSQIAPPAPLPTAKSHRPNKMEVRGRFTIIDLSPDPPSSQVEDPPPLGGHPAESSRPLRASGSTANGGGAASRMRRAAPPRRFSRSEKSSSMTMASSSAAAASMLPESAVLTAAMLRREEDHSVHNGRQLNGFAEGNGSRLHPQPPQLSPHGVDLHALDRHLVFLQQESLDMKALLESMISSNARWISALASNADSNVNSGKNPKAVHPTTSPTAANQAVGLASAVTSLPPPVAVPAEPTLEEKYEKLMLAHSDLQQKFDALAAESAQLKRNNLMLETRLRQETSVNEELRAHVDQLTQYTESLIYGVGDPPPRSEPNQRQDLVPSSENNARPENSAAEGEPTAPPSQERPLTAPRPQNHPRSLSMDSTALWVMENNQSGLEDDDESNLDSDDLNPRTAGALRRRRWRNMSRSASLSLEDDSASSVYSSSYRDSWVSLFDGPHMSSATSEWRYDDSSVEDTLFELRKARKMRFDSSDSALTMADSTSNQADDEVLERRRKSSAMIVEELEDNPAESPKAAVAAQ